MAETESAWWNSEVMAPAIGAGKGAEDIANPALADRATPLGE